MVVPTLKVAGSSLPVGISYATFSFFFFHYVFMTQAFRHVILGPKELKLQSNCTWDREQYCFMGGSFKTSISLSSENATVRIVIQTQTDKLSTISLLECALRDKQAPLVLHKREWLGQRLGPEVKNKNSTIFYMIIGEQCHYLGYVIP